MSKRVLIAALTGACCAPVSAQNLIQSPSFETADMSGGAVGWTSFNLSRYRTSGDGLSPGFTAQDGFSAVELPGGADFGGFTTDSFTREFNPPLQVPNGGVTASGWYMIPASSPLTSANAGLKLEFRRDNGSIWRAIEDLSISGHTGGDWVFTSLSVPSEDLDPGLFPGEPTSVSVMAIRFGSAGDTGTVFWDSLSLTEEPPLCQLASDYNGDDTSDISDLLGFLADWFPEGQQACPFPQGPDLMFNGGFELDDGLDGAEGWAPFNNGRYRTNGDGDVPAVTARTGVGCIELPGTVDFSGFTTDVFNIATLEFYNPAVVSPSGGVVVTGYYMIPASAPLVSADAGLKLEFRRDNTSIWNAFEVLTINGHTDGLWQEFSVTVSQAELDPGNNPGDGPVAVSVLPIRFGDAADTGTIFWDDITLTEATGLCSLNADFNKDSLVNINDLLGFLGAWFPEMGSSCPN